MFLLSFEHAVYSPKILSWTAIEAVEHSATERNIIALGNTLYSSREHTVQQAVHNTLYSSREHTVQQAVHNTLYSSRQHTVQQ